MRQTRDHFVILLARLEAMGVDREQLVEEAQIDLGELESSRGGYFHDGQLLEAAARISGDPLVAIRAHICWGSNYRSLFERYLRSLPNLATVLKMTGGRYSTQFPDVARRVEVSDGQFRLLYGFEPMPAPISVEHYMMTGFSFFVRAAGERARPSAVLFRHSARADRSEYESLFGCPVHFDESENSFVASAKVLELPLLQASAEVSEALRTLLAGESGSGETTPGAYLTEIGATLRKMLHEGIPLSVETVAERLGVSGRTLQRRLTDEGASFRMLRCDALSSFAKQRLAQSGSSMAEIATELGFQTPTSFSRAFVTWTGESPSAFRSRHRGR